MKKRRAITLIAPYSLLWSYSPAMKNIRFRLLTHEEFAQLPTEEKFAYLARAVVSTPSENQPLLASPRKPSSSRTVPKPERVRTKRGAAAAGE